MNPAGYEPDYLEFYGLTKDPFAADADIFCPVGKRHDILEQLIHLNQFSHLTLVVLAPDGYGKTTLFNVLKKQLLQLGIVRIVSFAADPDWTVEAILQQIADSWGISVDTDDIDQALRTIRSHHLSQSVIGIRHCILIDDADQLQEEALETIYQLVAGLPEDQAIGVTLFGNEGSVDFRTYFKPANMIHTIHLSALSNKEVFVFLQDHFEAVGHKRGVPFSPEVVEKIYLSTEGIPLHIKRVAAEYMSQQARSHVVEKHSIPLAHFIAIGALVVLILVAFLYQRWQSRPEPVVVAPADNKELSERLQQAVAKVEARQQPQAETTPTKESSSPGQPETPTDEAISQPIPVQPIEQPKTIPVESKVEAPKQETVNVPGEKEVAKPVVPKTAEVSKSWFNTAKDDAFTIQLLGVRTEQSIKDFIQQQDHPERFAYYKTTFQKKDWYVAVTGEYRSKNEALAAVNKMPEALNKLKPWVRPIADIRLLIEP